MPDELRAVVGGHSVSAFLQVDFSDSGTPWPSSLDAVGVLSPYSELTPHSGDFDTVQDGQIVEDMDIAGRLRVQHDNVLVRNCRIRYTTNYGLDLRWGNTGTVVEDCEFDGVLLPTDESRGASYDAGAGFVLRRCSLHTAPDGFGTYGNSLIEDCYVIVSEFTPDGDHRTAFSARGSNNTFRRNVLICSVQGGGCSSAVSAYGTPNPVTNLTMEENFFAGACGYCLYAGAIKEHADETHDIVIVNNAFSTLLFSEGGWKYESDTDESICGQAGTITAFDPSGPGNIRSGNYLWPSLTPID